jgi:ATP-dependent Clp protease adapter protein ClpS
VSNSGGFNPRKPAAGIPVNPPSTFSSGRYSLGISFVLSASGNAIERPCFYRIFLNETSGDGYAQTPQIDCADVLRTFFNLSALDAKKLSETLVQKGEICLPKLYTRDVALTRVAAMDKAIKEGRYPGLTLVAYEVPATASFGQIPRSP